MGFNKRVFMDEQIQVMPKHTILIVDDEDSIRDMLSIALDAAGYNVLQALNAQTAHSLVVDRNPDLILLDWMMPGTTGLELLRRLKRDEITEKIPVIMLTAKAQEANKLSGLDAGADDYIVKPFSPNLNLWEINIGNHLHCFTELLIVFKKNLITLSATFVICSICAIYNIYLFFLFKNLNPK
jgi:CheY-like chemotaxis protein